ncbi:GntR family transcriptional regulator [Paracoccus sp. 11-3]|uniref:GntR family transcriptional regulator n=1 Tax=Paracoccus amoyensis TaxID=2760093 RepID=A0A926JE94_9RHOB|nr:GntR family transcriptional regulator [Paracoccus amoyensis]MBC9247973.1 GntR family transcriptional regulator [Paracoccus amoyensis]
MNPLFDTVAFTDSTAGPLYPQRHRRIAEEIATGRLKADDHLSPKREMAAQTDPSRVTIRKGIQAVVTSGQSVQRRGKGARSQWLSRDIHAPTPAEGMALGPGTNDRVARPEPVRRSDGVPLAIERVSYLENGQAVEFTRSVYRGDADDVVVELASAPQLIKDGA